MTQTNVRVQMQIRRDTAANWNSADPILLAGEWGYETDSGKIKIGDGSTTWLSLDHAFVSTKGGNMTDHLTIHNKKELRLTDNTQDTAQDHYSAFKAGTQSADLTYTLPTTQPGSGTEYLGCTSSGVLSWVAGSSSDGTKMPLAGGTFTGDVIHAADVTFDGATAGTDITYNRSTNNLKFSDNAKINFGTDGDLFLFHDGNDSYINESGSGDLIIDSSHIIFKDGGTEVLETTNSGIRIKDNLTLAIGSNSDLKLMHDTSENFILSPNNHTLNVEGDEIQLRAVNNEKYFKGVKNGASELYYNDVLKFQTSGTGIEVKSTTDAKLLIENTADGDAILHLRNTGSTDFQFKLTNAVLTIGTTTKKSIKATANQDVVLYYNDNTKLATTSSGVDVTGTVNESSDIALKTNIEPLENVLDKIKQINGFKYKFKNNNSESIGVIAQDVEKVFPELVHGSEGSKSLQYSGLIGALIESVKELSERVALLEG